MNGIVIPNVPDNLRGYLHQKLGGRLVGASDERFDIRQSQQHSNEAIAKEVVDYYRLAGLKIDEEDMIFIIKVGERPIFTVTVSNFWSISCISVSTQWI